MGTVVLGDGEKGGAAAGSPHRGDDGECPHAQCKVN